MRCGREECFPCMGEEKDREKCSAENVTYQIVCEECKMGDVLADVVVIVP